MAAMSGPGSLEEKRYKFLVTAVSEEHTSAAQNEEMAQLRLGKEFQMIHNGNPFRVVEMAFDIQVEKMRVIESMKARDAAVHRLSDAYIYIRQKSELIEQLQQERELHGLGRLHAKPQQTSDTDTDALKAHIITLEAIIKDLKAANTQLKEYVTYDIKLPIDPPPHYEQLSKNLETTTAQIAVQTDVALQFSDMTIGETTKLMTPLESNKVDESLKVTAPPTKPGDVAQSIQSRNLILASIPLPPNPPDITLVPIILPPQVSLHDFLNSAPTALRNSLGSFQVLQSVTTTWCSEREEHGYMYTPMFKCSTNPRTITAHRWSAIDVIGRMNKPTECFYNNEGIWYYAGSYKAFHLDVVSTTEWEELSSETTSALIKETLSARKNTTPQNTYETSQLYAAGALKAVCLGLQCVGFNQEVYRSVSDLAMKLAQTKWKVNNGTLVGPLPSPLAGASSILLPPSKVGSPMSGYGSPATPCLSNSVLSTPGVSPGNIGLGASSPAWNAGISLNSNSPRVSVPEGGENVAIDWLGFGRGKR